MYKTPEIIIFFWYNFPIPFNVRKYCPQMWRHFSDNILSSNGQRKTPFQVSLPECVHNTCRSKSFLQTMNRLSLRISYDELGEKRHNRDSLIESCSSPTCDPTSTMKKIIFPALVAAMIRFSCCLKIILERQFSKKKYHRHHLLFCHLSHR